MLLFTKQNCVLHQILIKKENPVSHPLFFHETKLSSLSLPSKKTKQHSSFSYFKQNRPIQQLFFCYI